MPDRFSTAERSRIMRAVRGKDTKPEWVVRRLVHRLGYRYRLHVTDLPGKPDLVFPARRKVVFVHGCFWHQHHCKRGNRTPASNVEYWRAKLQRNRQRDAAHRRALRRAGWSVMVIWECQTRAAGLERLSRRLVRFLES